MCELMLAEVEANIQKGDQNSVEQWRLRTLIFLTMAEKDNHKRVISGQNKSE